MEHLFLGENGGNPQTQEKYKPYKLNLSQEVSDEGLKDNDESTGFSPLTLAEGIEIE